MSSRKRSEAGNNPKPQCCHPDACPRTGLKAEVESRRERASGMGRMTELSRASTVSAPVTATSAATLWSRPPRPTTTAAALAGMGQCSPNTMRASNPDTKDPLQIAIACHIHILDLVRRPLRHFQDIHRQTTRLHSRHNQHSCHNQVSNRSP